MTALKERTQSNGSPRISLRYEFNSDGDCSRNLQAPNDHRQRAQAQRLENIQVHHQKRDSTKASQNCRERDADSLPRGGR